MLLSYAAPVEVGLEKPFNAYTGPEPYVFVCYAHEDAEIVYRELCWLRDIGVRVWYDEGISAGENWRSAIGDALLSARRIIFFISRASLESHHCNREINLALDEGKQVFPIYLEPVELTTDLKVGLNRVQALFWNEGLSHRAALERALLGTSPERAEPPQTAPAKRSMTPIALAALAVLAAAALTFVAVRFDWFRAPPGQISRIAVLPFENLSNDESEEYFVDGITDALITELEQIQSLKVVSRTSVLRYRNTDKPAPEIGRELDADGLVEGTVLRAGDEVRITARLIDAARDEHLWARSFTERMDNVLRLQAEVVVGITRELNAVLTPREASNLAQAPTINPAAYDAYLRGRHFGAKRTGPDLERALEFYRQAIDLDPGFAEVHAGIASAFLLRGVYEYADPVDSYAQARAAANRAIALDPSTGEAHAVLGHVFEVADLDWAQADAAFRTAIEVGPNNVTSLLYYSYFLMVTGRLDQAAAVINQAAELDPLSPLAETFRAQLALYRGQFEEAISIGARNVEAYPGFPASIWRLGEAYMAAGRFEEAVATFERLAEITDRAPLPLSYLGMAYARAGSPDRARAIADEVTATTASPALLPGRLARISLGLGDHDATIEQLGAAIGAAQMVVLELHGAPAWDPLRDDPRFQAVLERISLSALSPAE